MDWLLSFETKGKLNQFNQPWIEKKKKAEKSERIIEPCWPEADRCCSATAFSATN